MGNRFENDRTRTGKQTETGTGRLAAVSGAQTPRQLLCRRARFCAIGLGAREERAGIPDGALA